MSMQKLSRIKSVGTYTAQRGTVEHLLLLEEILLREVLEEIEILTTKIQITSLIANYRTQHHIIAPFDNQDIQNYFLATTEQELTLEKSRVKGLYTSILIEQAEGNDPIIIDMQGEKIDYLLYAINTPRHITINNTKGDCTGAYAGSYHGQANLTINNAEGDCTGAYAGSHYGQAHLTINNTKGDNTGVFAGSYRGMAHLTINNTTGKGTGASAGMYGYATIVAYNTNGNLTGKNAGSNNGHAIIVAYNTKGDHQFFDHKGTLVNYYPNETQRIEGVTDGKKEHILNLIAQNAPPEDIMAYLRGNT